MEAYINGIGIISPQKTFNTNNFLIDIVEYNTRALYCIEPDYKEFLNPLLARRMARIIKMSIAASTICIKQAEVEQPDAIITGTALGCLEDTEKFLTTIIDNDEQFLTPTSFIQSTHNTVGAQITLQLKCLNYNFTYVHKGFSFESALLDGLMTLTEGDAKNVLVGGHDEMRDKFFRIYDRIGYWKKENVNNTQLINSKTNGSISGEGAAFFMLSKTIGKHTYAKLKGVKTIYKPINYQAIEHKITAFLNENNLKPENIDVALYGINGDARFDNVYHHLKDTYFKKSTSTYFKHLCGEYQTASSFAMWVAAMVLKTQTIPTTLLVGKQKHLSIKNVLIYNTFLNTNHTVFLLSKC